MGAAGVSVGMVKEPRVEKEMVLTSLGVPFLGVPIIRIKYSILGGLS